MKTLLSLLTCFVFCSFALAETAYIHPDSGIKIPAKLGTYQFNKGTISPDKTYGTALSFKSKDSPDPQLTLYIYEHDQPLAKEIAEVHAAILKYQEKGVYAKVELSKPAKIKDAEAYYFSGKLRIVNRQNPINSTPVNTYSYLMRLGKFSVKARVTSSTRFKDHEKHWKAVEQALLTMLKEYK